MEVYKYDSSKHWNSSQTEKCNKRSESMLDGVRWQNMEGKRKCKSKTERENDNEKDKEGEKEEEA